MVKKTSQIILLGLLLTLMASAQEDDSQQTQVVWFEGKAPITYSIPKKVEPVVKIALGPNLHDVEVS